jgi:DNA-binding transcriptional MerR regulator
MFYTISTLCKEYKLSRSTLLYYDSIGLLKASKRTGANYRHYSEEDRQRLARICTLRETGVPLKQIKDILEQNEYSEVSILEDRLKRLNQEISYLRLQQKLIVSLLKEQKINTKMLFDKDEFAFYLQKAGVNEEGMELLHKNLENDSPEAHQFFLEFLGLEPKIIQKIREHYKDKN